MKKQYSYTLYSASYFNSKKIGTNIAFLQYRSAKESVFLFLSYTVVTLESLGISGFQAILNFFQVYHKSIKVA